MKSFTNTLLLLAGAYFLIRFALPSAERNGSNDFDKPAPFELGEIEDIIELSTVRQSCNVLIDTTISIDKSFFDMELLESLKFWTKPTASVCYQVSYLYKAGFDLMNDSLQITVNDSTRTVYVEFPQAKILSIESDYENEKDIVPEGFKSNGIFVSSDYFNQKYVSQGIWANLRYSAKQRGMYEVIKNGLLDQANDRRSAVINYLSKINPKYNIEIQ